MGVKISGPLMMTNDVPMDEIPVYIRSGAVLPLAPQMEFTAQKPWDPVTLDIYAQPRCGDIGNLYEDDTITTAYQHGRFRNTQIAVSCQDHLKSVRVDIGAAQGHFKGELTRRIWVLRLHMPAGWPKNLKPTGIEINGRPMNSLDLPIRLLARNAAAMPFGDPAGAPDGDVFEIALPSMPVLRNEIVDIDFTPQQAAQ